MRNRWVFASLPVAAFALAWACNNNRNPNLVVGDDASDDSPVEAAGDDDGSGSTDTGNGSTDATNDPCTLSDKLSDPVALCVQQQILQAELQYAYVKGQGVAPGWSSTGPGYAPLTGHAWQDDLGLAGTLGAYYCSSEVYGNNHSTAAFNAVLSDLGAVLVGELQGTPSPLAGSYDGEIYFRLRWAQAAYNYINDASAGTLKGLADAYGAGLATQAYVVAPAGDGGSPGGMVIGTKNGDGTVTYAPAQSVMAAAALLDMASLNANTADAGTLEGWVTTAQQVLSYVLSRGMDPGTGLFYQSLTTSADPTHDTPAPGTPTSDSMLTETQAWVMLGLARAQDLLDPLQNVVDGGAADASSIQEPYWIAGATLAGSMTAANLFDGTTTPPTPPPPGAFMEGLVLSGQQLLTNKTTIGNAILLGGFHRVFLGAGSPLGYELGEVRSALVQPAPAHSSLFTIVTASNGDVVQQSYLRAGSQAFGYALAYPTDAGAEEQGSRNYRSDAIHAMVEGFNQLWHGASDDARCAP